MNTVSPVPGVRPRVNVTLPVYNEAGQLAASVGRVREFLRGQPQWDWEVVIADNGSTDGTGARAAALVAECASPKTNDAPALTLRLVSLPVPGRGRALKTVWLASEADVLSYMDLDLSTDLAHLPELIGPLLAGRADVALGSRHLPESRVIRGWKRTLLSRGYNRLVRLVLGLPVRDAQCGFKALSRAAAQALLPQVQDPGFFFDTELLARAHWGGWRLLELPVRWVDDPDSRVRLLPTILADLRGLARLRRERPRASRPSPAAPTDPSNAARPPPSHHALRP
jgi:glycosyltransferase involved in cell wall biosynthesis